MLRLPKPSYALGANCSYAIAQVLAASVSGISVTLYSQTGRSGARFKGLLRNFYPWNQEPGNVVTAQIGSKAIYQLFRNPLTHDLGLDIANRRRGQKM